MGRVQDIAPSPPCAWCSVPGTGAEDDHLFPRSIGGTKELVIPACRHCQDIVSVAERELARRSLYSLCLVESGPKGRDKRDPNSGYIHSLYTLVRHPLGGYGEVAFRAGQSAPTVLPYIEIDIASTWQMRRRGASPKDVDKLARIIQQIFRDAPEQVIRKGRIPVRTEELHDIGADNDFWPRAALPPDGKPFVRARDKDEAIRFERLAQLYLKNYKFGEYAYWESCEIAGGEPHHFAIQYKQPRVLRAIAKIAWGLGYLRLDPPTIGSTPFTEVRDFITGSNDTDIPSSVREVRMPGDIALWPDRHVAGLFMLGRRITGAVSLYGGLVQIDFGPQPPQADEILPIAAICRHDGSRARLVDSQAALEIARSLSDLLGDRH
jgi:hypothetical protein